jgi:hypothetical protein
MVVSVSNVKFSISLFYFKGKNALKDFEDSNRSKIHPNNQPKAHRLLQIAKVKFVPHRLSGCWRFFHDSEEHKEARVR